LRWNNGRLRIAFACLLLLLAACNRGSEKPRIAVVPKATSHVFWQTVHAGVVAAGRELNVEVLWNSPTAETDFSRQIQIVDSMLVQRVDGLAVAASDRKALDASLDRAAQLHIPVTVFDSGVDSTNYMTFLATNNYEAGQMAARKLAELIGGKGKVAMVQHMPGSYSTMERERGFEDVIQKDFPGIEIVARQYGMADRSKSMAAAENMLTAHPDLQGMFGSTEPSSTGTSLALKERKLAGKVKFVAFDSADNMIEDLRAGVIHAMVVQDPFKMGYEAVKTLVDKLHGSQPPKKMDLSARVVTKEDLDKPDVHALLFPDLKKYLN
jgi:ribose transport system substrate-binding protein